MFKDYCDLSFNNPFYLNKDDGFILKDNFLDIISEKNSRNFIDPVAVLEILNKGYILGNRTIVKDIYKSPWMAKPNSETNEWRFYSLPPHEEAIISEEKAAGIFFELLQRELKDVIGGKKNIGILLTGGMDSRVVAGTLDYLIRSGELLDLNIKAFTWGDPYSRDVIYAKEIAKRLNWKWEHINVDSSCLLENIKIAAENGCEYSPIHLHGMIKVRDQLGLDCVLAGSFGDSIGRAEYSGKHVSNIVSLKDKIRNNGFLLNHEIVSASLPKIESDIDFYHGIFPQVYDYQQFELDYQCHYMRRMLNPCMAIINKKIPLYQLFSKPYLFEFVWGLHPSVRTNNLYKIIISSFKSDLKDIRWARTGLEYDESHGTPDNYKRSHHDYGKLISSEIFPNIKELVCSKEIEDLKIFNMNSIRNSLRLVNRFHIKGRLFYEDQLSWIASLAVLAKKINLSSDQNYQNNLADKMNSFVKLPAEFLYRKIKFETK